MTLRLSIARAWLSIALLAAARPSLLAGQLVAVDSAAIDRAVMELVDSGFSGVVLVARGDSLVLRRAYSRRGPALTPASAFWIASMTKGFTAVAILQLVQDGRLSLTDSLGGLLQGVAADKRGITIQQLLTHSAGLAGEYSGGGIADRAEAVRAILAPPLAYPPGHGYRYGDDDFELLSILLEVVTGRPWERYLSDSILAPLDLTSTGFHCGRQGAPAPVAGVDITDARCRSTADEDWGHKGANGMSSTADDLLRWIRGRHGPLLTAATRQRLAAPQILVRHEGQDDISIGYGVRIYSRSGRVTEVMHSGSGDDGQTSIARELPDGTVIIVLSNAGRHGGGTWASYVAQRLASRQ